MKDRVPLEIEQELAFRLLRCQGLSGLLEKLGAESLCRAAWETRNGS